MSGKSFNVFSLLEKGLQKNDDTSVINLALTLLKNQEGESGWRQADQIFRNMGNCSISANWWYTIAQLNNDPEGHLVLGWLSRHKKIEDPDLYSYQKRLMAAKKGWDIPSWLTD